MVKIITAILLFAAASAGASELPVVSEATRQVTLTGYSRAVRHQDISPEIAGKVVHISFDTGDRITASPFIELDTTFVDLHIVKAEQAIEQQIISIEKTTSRVSYLQKEVSRVEELGRDQMATESRQDAVRQDLAQARLDLIAADKEIARLRTELSELRERKERHFIHAPEGWMVTMRDIEAGEYVRAGDILAKVSDFSHLVIPIFVSSDELSAIRSAGPTLNVMLENIPATASLNWVNPDFNEKTRKTEIELKVTHYSGITRGGLKMIMPLTIAAEGLFIPKEAVIRRYDNPVVKTGSTGNFVSLVVLGDEGSYLHIADNDQLSPGMELLPAEETDQPQDQ